MDANFFGEMAVRQSRQIFESARREATDPVFRDSFTSQLNKLLLLRALERDFPASPIRRLTPEEGPSGVTPAGAKPTILRSVLSDEPVPPLRISYTEKTTPKDYRLIDKANIYFLVETGVGDIMNSNRIRAVLKTFEALSTKIGARNAVIAEDTAKGLPDLLVGEFGLRLQLIKRSGLGVYQFHTKDIKTLQDLEQAITDYEAAVFGTLDFTDAISAKQLGGLDEGQQLLRVLGYNADFSTVIPENDTAAYDRLNGYIREDVQNNPSAINLPIVLQPGEFSFAEGDQLGYLYRGTPLYKILGNASFVNIPNNPNQHPTVVKYDTHGRVLAEINM